MKYTIEHERCIEGTIMRKASHTSEHGESSSPVDNSPVNFGSLSRTNVNSTQNAQQGNSHTAHQVYPMGTDERTLVPQQVADRQTTGPALTEPCSYQPGVNVMLTLERPSTTALAGCERGERYRVLMAHAQAQRARIITWADEEGICDEIMRIGQANTFHLLFLYCTPEVAKRLAGAPGVVDVAIAPAV
ncbi:MAG TPA: hypothetical protein P5121_29290 [Caldilineaceae bacterium]|nr:hypothetical protein [Caldilineaceae bacterium]